VGVADINGASALNVAESIIAGGGQAPSAMAPTAAAAGLLPAGRGLRRDAGPLRAVINNASVLVYEPIEQVTEETLDRMLSAGLKSVFWGVQAFLAHRDEKRARQHPQLLLARSPIAGGPTPGPIPRSRRGIAGLTKVLAGELGPRGIRVNAIAPGSVPTPATEGFVTPEQYEQRAKNIPLRRNGTPRMWRRRSPSC
jgi:NAD(P)-dependent dehydrogenase (short-subunit alcohol dehydrogenase family)